MNIEKDNLEKDFKEKISNNEIDDNKIQEIVKKIVEEHGGIIWAENCDKGACMVVQLPMLLDLTRETATEESEL